MNKWNAGWLILLLGLLLVACTAGDVVDDGRLKVVATTTIVGDVVAQVGGEVVDLTILLPPNADPHGYEPTAQDLRAIADADLVFMNGLGLEEFLEDMIETAGGNALIVALSEEIELDIVHAAEEDHEDEIEDEHAHGEIDPHVWFDVRYVMDWTALIADELAALDAENSTIYQTNALNYAEELVALDDWIHQQGAALAVERRVMVTNHDSFAYFARAYQFEIVGAVIAATSTMAEPSAQELAALQGIVSEYQVRAIFVEVGVNQTMAEQIAADTGIVLVELYTGSLSDTDGPAGSYLALMRYNVSAIVAALSE